MGVYAYEGCLAAVLDAGVNTQMAHTPQIRGGQIRGR